MRDNSDGLPFRDMIISYIMVTIGKPKNGMTTLISSTTTARTSSTTVTVSGSSTTAPKTVPRTSTMVATSQVTLTPSFLLNREVGSGRLCLIHLVIH